MTSLDRTHFVYRCYGPDGRLLYIGCTNDVEGRMAVHASAWSNPASAGLNLRMTRYESTVYPDKPSARAAERQAIHDEAPIFNLHHQRESLSPTARLARIAEYVESTRPALGADLDSIFGRPA